MSRHFRSMESLADWRQLHPERHWKPGYSAQMLAESWHGAGNAMPPAVRAALDSAADHRLHGLELVAAFGEYKTPLPGGSRPSHTDLLVVARSVDSLVVIGVEGKCQEAFGPTIAEWDRSEERLDYLQGLLPSGRRFDGAIRYQLLHRSASAAIEAERFHAPIAVMLVHQFGGECESWADYAAFLATFQVEARQGAVQFLGNCSNGIELFAGWVSERG